MTYSIFITFKAALFATIFALVFGTPLAYLLARFDFPGRRIIEAIIEVPIMVPHTAAGIALLVVFGTGRAAEFFRAAGIEFIGTEAGIVLGMLFVSIPFYIDSARVGFAAVDPRLENVARSLGAGRVQVFFRITLPLAFRSIFTGSLLMWGRGISEFGAVVVLAYHPMTASVLIYERFTSYGLKSSRPVAVLLIIICVFIFVMFKLISHIWEKRNAFYTEH